MTKIRCPQCGNNCFIMRPQHVESDSLIVEKTCRCGAELVFVFEFKAVRLAGRDADENEV
jgi:hypothetical protein